MELATDGAVLRRSTVPCRFLRTSGRATLSTTECFTLYCILVLMDQVPHTL